MLMLTAGQKVKFGGLPACFQRSDRITPSYLLRISQGHHNKSMPRFCLMNNNVRICKLEHCTNLKR